MATPTPVTLDYATPRPRRRWINWARVGRAARETSLVLFATVMTAFAAGGVGDAIVRGYTAKVDFRIRNRPVLFDEPMLADYRATMDRVVAALTNEYTVASAQKAAAAAGFSTTADTFAVRSSDSMTFTVEYTAPRQGAAPKVLQELLYRIDLPSLPTNPGLLVQQVGSVSTIEAGTYGQFGLCVGAVAGFTTSAFYVYRARRRRVRRVLETTS